MPQLVAEVYADALFSIALEENALDAYEPEIKFIHDMFANEPDFLAVMNHPQISSEEKFSIIENVYKGKVSDSILGMLALVFRKNRESSIMEILNLFVMKAKNHRNIVVADVASAVALNENQIKEIQGKLSKNLNKHVEVRATVDTSLIGGMKIFVDGKVIDGTVKKQINDVRNSLLNV